MILLIKTKSGKLQTLTIVRLTERSFHIWTHFSTKGKQWMAADPHTVTVSNSRL